MLHFIVMMIKETIIVNLFALFYVKLVISEFLNFPLLSASQIAPKFYSFVEQRRAKISLGVEANSI